MKLCDKCGAYHTHVCLGVRASSAAVPVDALPPLPKPWQERAQAELGDHWRGYKPDSYMEAEIAEWRARAAVEADRVQQSELVASALLENLRAALQAADAQKYEAQAWEAFESVFNRNLLVTATKAAGLARVGQQEAG